MIDKAVILSTGDELTTGRVVDTNSTFIAGQLSSIGIDVAAVLKVGDDRQRLLWAFREARELGDLVIGAGGLCPTADDLTTEIVAQFLDLKLHLNEEVAQSLKRRFAARGLTWSSNNLKQALFPEGSIIVPNPLGTAPGFRISVGDRKTLIWLSGVPQEMTAMFNQTVLPWVVEQKGSNEKNSACTFKVHGLTESKLDEMVQPIDLPPQAKLSFRAHYPDLSLRLTVRGSPETERTFVELKQQIHAVLGSYVYAEGDLTLEEVVGQLLRARKQTLALAESCTGGYISHRITRIAGSSDYYFGGAVTYSNELKIAFLGVKSGTLERHGAVSRETALEMSGGIREAT